MKKIIMIMVLMQILILAGCQKTPDNQVVTGKNTGEFENAIEEELPLEYTQNEYIQSIPEKWQESIDKYEGKLKIEIDAEVIVTDVVNYPVAIIEPYYITIDQANKIVMAVFGSDDVYYVKSEMTRSEMEDFIVGVEADYQQAINDGDEERAERLQGIIDDMTLKLSDASEEVELKKYTGEFNIADDGTRVEEYIDLRENPLDIMTPVLQIHNVYGSPYSDGFDSDATYENVMGREGYYLYNDENFLKMPWDENPLFETPEAMNAIETANRFLQDCGIEDRVIGNIVPKTTDEYPDQVLSYAIYYTRKFNGITIPANVQFGGSLSGQAIEGSDFFRSSITDEMLEVEIENNEVVTFHWNNIYSIKEIEKEDIRLMPFDEIMMNAQSQLSVKNAYLAENDMHSELYIDEIILTYAIESVKDKVNEYMLIPVWAFYGGHDYGAGYEMYDGNVLTGRHRDNVSLLTINAVDGTIINGQ